MAFRLLNLSLTCLWLAITSVLTLELPMQHAEPSVLAVELFTLNATNVSLSAPYHHNVTNGSVWVIPSSVFDLGARDMSCECFDPDRKHLPHSHPPMPHHGDRKLTTTGRSMLYGRYEINRSLLYR